MPVLFMLRGCIAAFVMCNDINNNIIYKDFILVFIFLVIIIHILITFGPSSAH